MNVKEMKKIMDEFDYLYEDCMMTENIEIKKTFVAREMAFISKIKYPDNENDDKDNPFALMYEKSLATHQKLAMMSFAKSKFIKCKNDFESIQIWIFQYLVEWLKHRCYSILKA